MPVKDFQKQTFHPAIMPGLSKSEQHGSTLTDNVYLGTLLSSARVATRKESEGLLNNVLRQHLTNFMGVRT